MPVHVEWLDESRKIVWYRVQGAWSFEEAIEGLTKAHQLSEPPPKLYLSDLREANTLPFGILSRKDEIADTMVLRDGFLVILGAHPLLRFFTNAIVRLGVQILPFVFV